MPNDPDNRFHIVMFKEVCPENLQLCERLGIKTARAPTKHTGSIEWAVKSQSLLFEKLGVMNALVPESMLDQLIKDPAVTDIVESKSHKFEPLSPVKQKKTNEEVVACSRDYAANQLSSLGIHTNYTHSTGQGVRVAVLDTGIDLTHPDLANKVTRGVNAISFLSGESVQDTHGHGTHCAGKIAGPVNPEHGPRYGVAPDAELLIGKVVDQYGYYEDHRVINGIYWAYLCGAKVISLSLGRARGVNQPAAIIYEQIARKILCDEENSALIVAASGNGSSRPHHYGIVCDPAAAASVMGVASVDHAHKVAAHSARQLDEIGEIDLCAPGVDVYSSWTGGGYDCETGTSMATAQIAGLAALHLSATPNLSAQQLWDCLESNAKSLGCRKDYGAGIGQAP